MATGRTDHVYVVRWSAEDQQYVATVAKYPSLSWLADDPGEAVGELHRMVLGVEDDLRAEVAEAAGDPVGRAAVRDVRGD